MKQIATWALALVVLLSVATAPAAAGPSISGVSNGCSSSAPTSSGLIPNPIDQIAETLEIALEKTHCLFIGFINGILDFITGIETTLVDMIVGTPHPPAKNGAVAFKVDASAGPMAPAWASVYDMNNIFTTLAFVILGLGSATGMALGAFRAIPRRMQKTVYRRSIIGGVFLIFNKPIIGLVLKFSDIFVKSVLPADACWRAYLFGAFHSGSTGSASIILMFIKWNWSIGVILINIVIMFGYLLIEIVRELIIWVLFAFAPLWIVGWAVAIGPMDVLGKKATSQLKRIVSVAFANVPAAILWQAGCLVFGMPAFSPSGASIGLTAGIALSSAFALGAQLLSVLLSTLFLAAGFYLTVKATLAGNIATSAMSVGTKVAATAATGGVAAAGLALGTGMSSRQASRLSGTAQSKINSSAGRQNAKQIDKFAGTNMAPSDVEKQGALGYKMKAGANKRLDSVTPGKDNFTPFSVSKNEYVDDYGRVDTTGMLKDIYEDDGGGTVASDGSGGTTARDGSSAADATDTPNPFTPDGATPFTPGSGDIEMDATDDVEIEDPDGDIEMDTVDDPEIEDPDGDIKMDTADDVDMDLDDGDANVESGDVSVDRATIDADSVSVDTGTFDAADGMGDGMGGMDGEMPVGDLMAVATAAPTVDEDELRQEIANDPDNDLGLEDLGRSPDADGEDGGSNGDTMFSASEDGGRRMVDEFDTLNDLIGKGDGALDDAAAVASGEKGPTDVDDEDAAAAGEEIRQLVVDTNDEIEGEIDAGELASAITGAVKAANDEDGLSEDERNEQVKSNMLAVLGKLGAAEQAEGIDGIEADDVYNPYGDESDPSKIYDAPDSTGPPDDSNGAGGDSSGSGGEPSSGGGGGLDNIGQGELETQLEAVFDASGDGDSDANFAEEVAAGADDISADGDASESAQNAQLAQQLAGAINERDDDQSPGDALQNLGLDVEVAQEVVTRIEAQQNGEERYSPNSGENVTPDLFDPEGGDE